MNWLPTRAQVDAFSRHAITAAGTAIAIFGLQSKGITIEQATAAINALGDTVKDLVTLIGSAMALYAAWKASHSASPTSQVASVAAIAQDPANPANVAASVTLISSVGKIAAAAAKPGERIDGATTAEQAGNVLEFAKQAKTALLDATAAQPEVVGKINVTDAELAERTESMQVVKAA